jgi:hypothetical protein
MSFELKIRNVNSKKIRNSAQDCYLFIKLFVVSHIDSSFILVFYESDKKPLSYLFMHF